jgi:hypothetical protein
LRSSIGLQTETDFRQNPHQKVRVKTRLKSAQNGHPGGTKPLYTSKSGIANTRKKGQKSTPKIVVQNLPRFASKTGF